MCPFAGELFPNGQNSLCDSVRVDGEVVRAGKTTTEMGDFEGAFLALCTHHFVDIGITVLEIVGMDPVRKIVKLVEPLLGGPVTKLLHIVHDGVDGTAGEEVPQHDFGMAL